MRFRRSKQLPVAYLSGVDKHMFSLSGSPGGRQEATALEHSSSIQPQRRAASPACAGGQVCSAQRWPIAFESIAITQPWCVTIAASLCAAACNRRSTNHSSWPGVACRVSHLVNVLVTSHAAQLAGAATAHVLSCLVAPVGATAALQLCPQLQLARLQRYSAAHGGPWPSARLRLQACLEDQHPAQEDTAGIISAPCPHSSQVLR